MQSVLGPWPKAKIVATMLSPACSGRSASSDECEGVDSSPTRYLRSIEGKGAAVWRVRGWCRACLEEFRGFAVTVPSASEGLERLSCNLLPWVAELPYRR